MGKTKYIFVFLILMLVGSVMAYPAIVPYVNDFADLLSTDEEQKLNEECHKIEQATSIEIAIVTIASTEGEDRTLYANHIGEESGVGQESKDNGVVILWSSDNEKGGAIATGRGIESILNDAKVGRIGRASRQFFDKGQYYQGFSYIVSEVKLELVESDLTQPTTTNEEIPPWVIILIIFVVVLFVVLLLIAISSDGGSGGSGSYRSTSYIGTSLGRSSGGSSWGSFGGGSFGGGGAKF